MTDVLRSNYEELFSVILNDISKSSFISIDAEYTGIHATNPANQNSLFDSPPVRYKKLRASLSKFIISQFGLSIFEKDWDENVYHVNSYNIYLFPPSFDEFRHRDTVEFQISCLHFLTANNFDFNKFIREGVPYLKESEAVRLRRYLKANPTFMRHMEIRDKVILTCVLPVESRPGQARVLLKYRNKAFPVKSLFNGYFPNYTPALADEEIEEIVERLRGFSKILIALQKSRKPVIGHNMLMDIMLLFQQFHEELPESYAEFKQKMHNFLPVIYDTKHLAPSIKRTISSENPSNIKDIKGLQDTNLFVLYKKTHMLRDFDTANVHLRSTCANFKQDMTDGLDETLGSHESRQTHCHEAGFDAVITGTVFIRLAHIISRHNSRNVAGRSSRIYTVTETISSVRRWENQVNLSRAIANYITLGVNCSDPLPNRPNWIRVESNPKRNALLNYSRLYGQLAKFGDVEVRIINSRCAVVACGGWGCAKQVWKCLEGQGFVLAVQEFPYERGLVSHIFMGWTGLLLISGGVAGILYWLWRKR